MMQTKSHKIEHVCFKIVTIESTRRILESTRERREKNPTKNMIFKKKNLNVIGSYKVYN